MNERIRELAEHCDFFVGNEHYNESQEEQQRLWTEKFAELIVRECMWKIMVRKDEAIDNQWNVDEAMSITLSDISEHFGVEE